MTFRRVIWIVLDSVGIGEMPDAAAYGDVGSDTLGNIAKLRPMHLPNFERLRRNSDDRNLHRSPDYRDKNLAKMKSGSS